MALTIRKNNRNEKTLVECTEEWFEDLEDILKNVQILGDSVLYNSNLSDIDIPDNVIQISDSAFANSSLQNVKIGNGVRTIGNGCFAGCEELKEISLSEGLAYIGYRAFIRCKNLSKITIPSTVEYIGKGAFYDTNVETLNVPKNCIVENQGREINIIREGITKKDLIQRMIADYTQKQSDEHPNQDLDNNILDLLNRELKNYESEVENKTTDKGITQ